MDARLRDRLVAGGSLVLMVVVAWRFLWLEAQAMEDMAMPPLRFAEEVGGAFVMWAIMMVGMMLPSAAPAMLFYGTLVRRHRERGSILPAVWTFIAGYLFVWTAFSLGAALLQAALLEARLVTPMLASASKPFTAALLVTAGLYQWSPFKDACLNKCRHPMEFFTMRWRAGAFGAWRMGLDHGLYCLGCCWLLMLLLFAVGAMDLVWVAVLAAFVFAEKLLPAAKFTTRAAGVGLVVAGAFVLLA
jgi:predicted metal-binding membrane protein